MPRSQLISKACAIPKKKPAQSAQQISGARLLIQCLERHGVQKIFGIPGAKIDTVFDALRDSKIQLILCRHEQNAAFMAAAHGRLTGQPGVVLVTSGPGVSNLATGLLTATTEGDPVVAIGGNVSRAMKLKESHQATNNIKLLESVTKSSVEITLAKNIPEIIDNAFRIATQPKRGAAFISFPQDIGHELTEAQPHSELRALQQGPACEHLIQETFDLILKAKLPVLLLGQEASLPENTQAIRDFLTQIPLPVINTFQAAGTISRSLQHCFFGRVGLFKNQPGDQLLDLADLIITVGFNPVEYDPELWNIKSNIKSNLKSNLKSQAPKKIISIDQKLCDIHTSYRPALELIGQISSTLNQLSNLLISYKNKNKIKNIFNYLDQKAVQLIKKSQLALLNFRPIKNNKNKNLIHPLDFIHALREAIDDQVLITCDIGTNYMWMARYFYIFEPRHLLFSNGQQTLGVALPWAMAARLAYPKKTIISISGDGGFLFSSMELETAVRYKISLIHFVWVDGFYDMVKEQQLLKYQRDSGVKLGYVDIVKYAESFGAVGEKINSAAQIPEILKKYKNHQGPVLIEIPIDYQDNPLLFKITDTQAGH